MLIQKFDEDKDGMLNRAEFGRLFTPNDPTSALQLVNRKAFNSDGFYSRENVWIYFSDLNRCLQNEQQI